ncbi:hypothetical protein [Bradyrhizobium sp. UASWS1016]|jgi:membrane protein implicated in regulation of membrane protease activity|uniref:hypothetical protein n=1 Tax=Bradyrhizobium sp. UASWS1016 TaxID=1566379 RepID=UPI0011AE9C25|nr:hypothetical protein [Bradyrhizobium sp. UASWS1016]
MNERTIGAIAAMLAVLCCGGPVLVSAALGAAGTAGLLSWLFKSLYFAIPAVFIALGLVGVWLHRRHSRTSARFGFSRMTFQVGGGSCGLHRSWTIAPRRGYSRSEL